MIKFAVQKGKFIKHCPCTPEVVPCGYYNLNLHTGCPYGCSYCILQAYLETTEPVFFTNIADMEKELAEIAQTQKYLRIGTGELTDSLALDPRTGYSHKILAIFEKFPQIVFEFKTKSAHVENLLCYEKVLKNIVVSWSLNPREFIEREEHLTPGLDSRLAAMAKVQARGYKIGIHFDPIVIFAGWQTAYLDLVKEIARVIDPLRIAWWSLGALRFPYALRGHIFKHRDSRLFEGELVKGHDGKYRYFKPLRLQLFRYMKEIIQTHISKKVPLYLCMEDKEVWAEIFPGPEANEETVNKYLYEAALNEKSTKPSNGNAHN